LATCFPLNYQWIAPSLPSAPADRRVALLPWLQICEGICLGFRTGLYLFVAAVLSFCLGLSLLSGLVLFFLWAVYSSNRGDLQPVAVDAVQIQNLAKLSCAPFMRARPNELGERPRIRFW